VGERDTSGSARRQSLREHEKTVKAFTQFASASDDAEDSLAGGRGRGRGRGGGSSRSTAAGGSGGSKATGGGEDSKLAALFEPPVDILWKGADIDQAREEALKDGKWLLVNIQSHSEFASHLLNRDTWSDTIVKEAVKSGFVLMQMYDSSEQGQKFNFFYKINKLPCVVVVDPMTGSKMFAKEGQFVDAQTLLDDLLPFMDSTPETFSAKKRFKTKGNNNGNANGSASVNLTEEEQMARAIEASLKASVGQQEEEEEGQKEEERKGEETTTAIPKLPQVPLEEEPQAGDPNAITVAVTLVSGERQKRRFLKDSRMSQLTQLCMSLVPEAMQGRPFKLVSRIPGAPDPMSDLSQTLDQAGVANQALMMVWS
jgi:hypothetical protein